MKILALVISIFSIQFFYPKAEVKKNNEDFKLSYISVGLGSNMFTMQPAFRVTGKKFIYTSEQAWIFKNKEIAKPDTLQLGNFRSSSIDSILSLVKEIKDSVIYKFNSNVMSGGIHYIDISSNKIKIRFELDNSSDPIAQKIVDILNSYILNPKKKLWLYDNI